MNTTTTLFPPIEPYRTFKLKVSGLHQIYVEEAGNPQGAPILFLHGGPGSGLAPHHRQYFDPAFYRVVLFDQRGAGQSTPYAEVEENTTWDLVGDIEAIRKELKIERWVVFGGSWGSTLSLAYAQMHPQRVLGLILRGIFLSREEDIRWFYEEGGASKIYPDEFAPYKQALKSVTKGAALPLVDSHYRQMFGEDAALARKSVLAWSRLENNTLTLLGENPELPQDEELEFQDSLGVARIECHYFQHLSYLQERPILANAPLIAHIPTKIIHGRYDVICSFDQAYLLHQALKKSELMIIQNAGHYSKEPNIVSALIDATQEFKSLY